MQKKIIVLADTRKEEVCESLSQVRPWLEQNAVILGWFDNPDEIEKQDLGVIDYFIIFGGDGLLLSAARHLGKSQIPVIGVNFGKLGFLAELKISEFIEQLERILRGDCRIARRMMLHCAIIRSGQTLHSSLALNDAVIKCTSASRMLYTGVAIDNESITTYGGDGVIVATPVGSTAYSLSAGGPVLSPTLSALVITPICPHVLTLRPLVISSYHTIEISLVPPYPGEIILSIDGQVNYSLKKNDRVLISQAQQNFYLVQPIGHRSFFKILQEKLTWGELRINHFNRYNT